MSYKFDEADLGTLADVARNERANSNDMQALKPMFQGWYAANKGSIGEATKLATVAKLFVDDLPVEFDDKRQKIGPKGAQSLTLYGAYVHKARHGLAEFHNPGSAPSPWCLTGTGITALAEMSDDALVTRVRAEIEQRTAGK